MRQKIRAYIVSWKQRGYPVDIPDEVPARLEQLNKAPSYKALVKAILKNDFQLKCLGYSPKKTAAYNQLKRIELSKRHDNLRSNPKSISDTI